jgi:hypothetical protein
MTLLQAAHRAVVEGLIGLRELNAPHRRHLISIVPAIALGAALNSSARHDAQRTGVGAPAEGLDSMGWLFQYPARPSRGWRGDSSLVQLGHGGSMPPARGAPTPRLPPLGGHSGLIAGGANVHLAALSSRTISTR